MAEPIEIHDDWIATCEAAARAGGRELLKWRGRFTTREKSRADLVTEADVAAQDAIRGTIAARFPDHAFVGEEMTDVSPVAGDELVWIVDPLDGTTNYVHGYRQYAVSIALARGNEILVGVIYGPGGDECFSAVRQRGASCNGRPISSSSVKNVSESLAAVSLPASVRSDSPDLLNFVEAAQACQAVRRTGSAALNLAYVARGWFDAFWATQINPWDVAAGVLIVREAGGIVTGRNGEDFDLWRPAFLSASTRELHAALLNVLTPYP